MKSTQELREELRRLENVIASAYRKFEEGTCLSDQELFEFGVALARVDEVRVQIAAFEWRERTRSHG